MTCNDNKKVTWERSAVLSSVEVLFHSIVGKYQSHFLRSRWRNGVLANSQLNQRQTHRPDVRLDSIWSSLKSLRLI